MILYIKNQTITRKLYRKKEWVESMTEEYPSTMKNDVWDIVPKPKNKSVVYSKWFYKIKHAIDGSIEK